MRIVRTVVIDRPVEDVFAYVADPLNDLAWCAKVLSVEQVEGDRPGPGARYDVLHRPIPLRPARRMAYTCVESDSPVRIAWREEDGDDVIDITYELEPAGTSTRLTQRDEARLSAPASSTRCSGEASAATSSTSCERSSGCSSCGDPDLGVAMELALS